MNPTDADSMWLQKSLTLPDPMPDVTGTTPMASRKAAAPPSKKPTASAATDENAAPTSQHQQQNEEQAPSQVAKVNAGAGAGTSTPSSLPSPSQSAAVQPKTLAASMKSPAAEMELTNMLLDTSSLVASGTGAMPRASTSRYSMSRVSLSSSAFISAHEYDDLRAKYSQAKRELLKVSDAQKELDFARFELTRTQEELKMMAQSNATLKQDYAEAIERADRACKAKAELEYTTEDNLALKDKEVTFLKQQLEELRSDNAKRLSEITEQQESETQGRIQALRGELAGMAEEAQAVAMQLEELQRENDRLRASYETALADADAARETTDDRDRRIADLRGQLQESQEAHRQFVEETNRDREEAVQSQQKLANQRVDQVTRSKDACITELKEEVQELKDKLRTTGEEAAALRHTNQQLSQEVKQQAQDHARALRRAAEDHRLALSERDLQLESAVRDAKGSRSYLEEETQSLRHQLTKVSEELSTVAAVLAQREKQLSEAERSATALRERVLALEQDNMQLANDAEMNAAAADEANERIRRINDQKDGIEEEYSSDLRAAKDRIRELETTVMEVREELSSLRRQQTKEGDDGRARERDLRADLESVTQERDRLLRTANGKDDAEASAAEYRKLYTAEKQKTDALDAELRAAVNRCSTLEKRLDEELRRAISRAVTTTSPSSRQSEVPASCSAGLRMRSHSSTNSITRGAASSLKRARTEDARVFAISGFDGNDLLSNIKQLPNVAIAECKSNMPVPSNLTHLITNGQLTIKLLTALVRGCWVLPESFVLDSIKQRTWQREHDYGFQHEEPPLLKKRIFVTDAFSASKHYSTASLLLREGGAIVEDDLSAEEADLVLCTNHELTEFDDNGMNWEKMVELIYPVRVE